MIQCLWLLGGEITSPSGGWSKYAVRPGDCVTVIGLQDKKGINSLLLEKIVLPNGKEIIPGDIP